MSSSLEPPFSGRRFLLVSAAMGGGHLQITHELARRLEERGNVVRVVDQLDVMPPPTGGWLHRLYPWLVNRTPWLYQQVYDTFFMAHQEAGERAGIPVRLALSGLSRVVDDFRPDLAVSTYPLSALALGELRRREQLSCPAVTVITTFSVNNLWLHPSVDLELCISEPAAADAEGRTGRGAAVCGPVVRPGFQGFANGDAERRRLGIDPSSRVALVTTGSMGLAGEAEVAAGVIARLPGWVPVVLCGRSTALATKVRRRPGAIALPWTDDMPSLMAAADVLVDNNCGMCAKEALAAGLPVVTFRPIAGHGSDDTDALVRLGLTDRVHEEHELAEAIDRLVRDQAWRQERIARGRSLFVADAAAMLESVLGHDVIRSGGQRHHFA